MPQRSVTFVGGKGPHSWSNRMNFCLRAWISAATLRVGTAPALWPDAAISVASPAKMFGGVGHDD